MESSPQGPSPADRERLAELEKEWQLRYAQQPKLPSSALLSGAVAMALGFGAVMFLAFAWARGFPLTYCVWGGSFIALSLGLGLFNRSMARRWYAEVQEWSEKRRKLSAEIEQLRSAFPPLAQDDWIR